MSDPSRVVAHPYGLAVAVLFTLAACDRGAVPEAEIDPSQWAGAAHSPEEAPPASSNGTEPTQSGRTVLVPAADIGLDAAVDAGAMYVARDDWANNQTGEPGVTLAREMVFPPYVWVANNTQNTLSRVDTQTGREAGRYWVAMNPSRTAVDLNGDVWVGGRSDGRLTKVLWDRDQCPDRNGNGVIDTSSPDRLGPLNSATDPLADECVVYSEQPNPGSTSIRGIAAGPDGRVWFGFTEGGLQWIDATTMELGEVTPRNGAPLYRPDASGVQQPVLDPLGEQVLADTGGVYGLVVDREGYLYASSLNRGILPRFNTFAGVWEAVYTGLACQNYGIAIDGRDRVWLGCTSACGGVAMFDPVERRESRFGVRVPTPVEHGALGLVPESGAECAYGFGVTGLAVEPATGDVWASFYGEGVTGRLSVNEADPSTSVWHMIATSGGRDLRGVGFDAEGFAWTHGVGGPEVWRIDPDTNSLVEGYERGVAVGDGQHYTYSDFTGSTGLAFTAPAGHWTATVPAAGGARLSAVRWRGSVLEGSQASLTIQPLDDGGAHVGEPIVADYSQGSWESRVELPPTGLTGARFELSVRMTRTAPDARPVVNRIELIWADAATRL